MGVRYETFSAPRTFVEIIKAGHWWTFHEDPWPLHVHGVVLTGDEGAIFVGTKRELRNLGCRFMSAVDCLPDDRPDGTSQTVVELRKLDE